MILASAFIAFYLYVLVATHAPRMPAPVPMKEQRLLAAELARTNRLYFKR